MALCGGHVSADNIKLSFVIAIRCSTIPRLTLHYPGRRHRLKKATGGGALNSRICSRFLLLQTDERPNIERIRTEFQQWNGILFQ